MMLEYRIIELENNNKCAIIDTLEWNNKKYVLVIGVSNDEKFVDNKFIIGIYNESKNYFEIIEEDNLEYLSQMFLEKLIKKQELDKLLNNIELNLIKLRVKKIDNTNYKLKDSKGNIIIKNLIFNTNKTPNIDEYIYLSEQIIKEKNIFQYGIINNLDKINNNEVIKIETKDGEYFLQRYYG